MNRNNNTYTWQLGLIFLFISVIVKANDPKEKLSNHFKASKISGVVVIDGKLDEADWQKTEVASFEHFKNVEMETDQQETQFRMLWDEENLYVSFECKDQFITVREKERDGQPYFDDCAEIFLIPAPDSVKMHFGFELNLLKASNDFIYLNNIYQDKDAVLKSFDPEFEVEFTYDGTINNNSDIDKGWVMEMAIPINLFRGFNVTTPVQEGNSWYFLAVRQDRNDAEGNRRSTSTIFPLFDDGVHDPERFGFLDFVE